MNKIDKNKLILPIAIVLGCLILGGVFYMVQANKQKSIEKQQQTDLEVKKQQETRDYVAKQKSACLEIYVAEGKKFNNVNSWNYNDSTEKCEITYNDPKKKTQAQCNKELDESEEIWKPDPVPPNVFSMYLQCVDGTFTREF